MNFTTPNSNISLIYDAVNTQWVELSRTQASPITVVSHGTLNYTTPGNNTFTVPAGITSVTIDMAGAGGGQAFDNALQGTPGKGARIQATLAVNAGDILYLNVGGAGSSSVAGNAPATGGTGGIGGDAAGGSGWGSSNTDYTSSSGWGGAGGGGGASDVRSNGTALTNTVLMAGGGGGVGISFAAYGKGGNGGKPGTNGGNGNSATESGKAGTATLGGAATLYDPCASGEIASGAGTLANGGNGGEATDGACEYEAGGGGGGGYYGGSGGSGGGGGGGYSFTTGTGVSGATVTAGFQAGTGYITLTY